MGMAPPESCPCCAGIMFGSFIMGARSVGAGAIRPIEGAAPPGGGAERAACCGMGGILGAVGICPMGICDCTPEGGWDTPIAGIPD